MLNSIEVHLPLTAHSGKIRVKERKSIYEYGAPFASKQKSFNKNCYIEWQIGYDIETDEKGLHTFTASNGKNKKLFELSDYLLKFYNFNFISKSDIANLIDYAKNIKECDFIENNNSLQIKREDFEKRRILGIDFHCSIVNYPILLYNFADFNISVEIIIKEKQRAIGTQPMLYICIPIELLKPYNNEPLINRKAYTKEESILILDNKYSIFLLEVIKIFSILSKRHNYDIIEILNIIAKD